MRFFLVLLFWLTTSAVAMADYVNTGFDETSEASETYDNCMEKAVNGTNYDWQICGADYEKTLDRILNNLWRLINSEGDKPLPAQFRQKLHAEQRAWIAFKEGACRPFELGYAGRQGQVLEGPLCRATIITDRIDDLTQVRMTLWQGYPDTILYADYQHADQLLNLAWRKMMPRIKDSQDNYDDGGFKDFDSPSELIRGEQKDWINFKEKACQYEFSNMNKQENAQFREACLAKLTQDRQNQLAQYCATSDCGTYYKPDAYQEKDDWIIGCDQAFSCTAVGNPTAENDYDRIGYIRIRWQYNNPAPPDIRIVLSDKSIPQGKGEINYKITGGDETQQNFHLNVDRSYNINRDYSFDATVSSKDSQAFIAALTKNRALHFGLEGKKQLTLNLDAFNLFYNDTQFYVHDMYDDKIPPLPIIKPVYLTFDKQKEPRPKDIPTKKGFCPDDGSYDRSFHGANGQAFRAVCYGSEFTNNYEIYQVGKNRKSEPAVLDNKANWGLILNDSFFIHQNGYILDQYWELKDYRPDCYNAHYQYAYDGSTFRLASVAVNPQCDRVNSDDWPVIYRTDIKPIK